ncbi:hypothetical protein N9I08_04580 [Candidatus Pelagibacter sp.]|nr:hypothetical protein [Candidatus Pelagibacter sp.]
MITLSMYNGHNAAICVLKDGKILLNWELERFSRIKHDYGFNQDFLDKSLELCNLKFDDLDCIITNKQDYKRKPPWDVPSTNKEMFVKFKINNKEAYALNHHLCHVSSSYYSSPFDEATIITQDGGGDSENFSVGLAKGNKILNFETKLVTNIAGWWSSITLNNYRMKRIHRWDPGSGAGKIMALAAYGKPDDNIEQLLEDTMKLGPNKKYTDKYSAAFNHNEDLSDDTSQRSKDVAASLQSKTEKELKKIYDAIFESYPNKNLCLAGGIALNCVANTRVKSNFENLHVPPFPNDTGLAVGMALYHWHHILDKKKETKFFSPYLGPVYTKNENLNAIKKHNSLIRRFLKFEKKIFYEDSTIEKISDYIAQRKVICMYKGRSESGPRALGHRSIMCVPDSDNGRDYLNFKIKKREWYRPYAPIILDKFADDILEDYIQHSPYMTTSAFIKKNWQKKLDAVNHVDNSTRPQILERENNPFLYELIESVYRKTGIPVLLNTSFNKQEPIVETPENALNTFKKFDIDFLVLNDFIVRK